MDKRIAQNSTAFCDVCKHSVFNMQKHIETEEHKRSLRQENQENKECAMPQMNECVTKVVNKRHKNYDVYIGRGSPFGNPFKLGKDGDRNEVIEKYRVYFVNRITIDQEFRKLVLALKGRKLGCWCKPLACHGDVIRDFLEGELDAV